MRILIFERQVIYLKGYTTKQILDPDYFMPDNYNELVKIYKTLAKSADQRLVRLEAYQHEKGFEVSTQWAYARAMHDIQVWSGTEARRFNTAPPKDKVDLISKIQDIRHFLESPTSSKKGIISVFKKKADSLNKTMRQNNPDWTDLTWKDMAQYFDSKLYDKIDQEYGSKTKFKIIASLKKNKKEILEDINQKKSQHIKVQDEILEATIDGILKKYPKEVEQLLKAQ